LEQTNEKGKCPICNAPTYMEIDDRIYIQVGDKRRLPTIKCLGCGMSLPNCTCN